METMDTIQTITLITKNTIVKMERKRKEKSTDRRINLKPL